MPASKNALLRYKVIDRWFVFGRHSRSKMLTPFALDRIVSIETAPDEPYKDDPHFDPEQYFDPIIGITNLSAT